MEGAASSAVLSTRARRLRGVRLDADAVAICGDGEARRLERVRGETPCSRDLLLPPGESATIRRVLAAGPGADFGAVFRFRSADGRARFADGVLSLSGSKGMLRAVGVGSESRRFSSPSSSPKMSKGGSSKSIGCS
jgi:hypothetical protein